MPPPSRVPKIADPAKIKMTPAHIEALNAKLIDKGPTIALTSLRKTHKIEWTHGEFVGDNGSTIKRMYLHAVDRKTNKPLNAPKACSHGCRSIVYPALATPAVPRARAHRVPESRVRRVPATRPGF